MELKGIVKNFGFCRDIECKNGQTLNFCTVEVEVDNIGTVYASGITEDVKNQVNKTVTLNAEYSDKYNKYLFSVKTLGQKTDDQIVTEKLNKLFKRGE